MNIESPISGVPINSGVTNAPSSVVLSNASSDKAAPDNGVKTTTPGDSNKTPELTNKAVAPDPFKNADPSPLDTTSKIALDQATGLMQNIVTDRITDKVIRKIPSDEYIHLHRLLDAMVGGFVDKKI